MPVTQIWQLTFYKKAFEDQSGLLYLSHVKFETSNKHWAGASDKDF